MARGGSCWLRDHLPGNGGVSHCDALEPVSLSSEASLAVLTSLHQGAMDFSLPLSPVWRQPLLRPQITTEKELIFFVKHFQVAFSSLNLLLQTQALLASLNYLTTVIPSDGQNTGVAKEVQTVTEKQKNSALQKGMRVSVFSLTNTRGERLGGAKLCFAYSFRDVSPRTLDSVVSEPVCCQAEHNGEAYGAVVVGRRQTNRGYGLQRHTSALPPSNAVRLRTH